MLRAWRVATKVLVVCMRPAARMLCRSTANLCLNKSCSGIDMASIQSMIPRFVHILKDSALETSVVFIFDLVSHFVLF